MKRKEFLKSLGIGALGLSAFSFQEIIDRRPVIIYDNYLRGTFTYNLETIYKQLNVGQELILQREINNEYDKYAIAVFYNKHKLGYIAAYENIVLANMLDANVNLTSVISYLNKGENKNREIAIQVFCNLISPTPLLITELEKRSDDEDDLYRKKIYFDNN
ncbi:MAG: hiran domain protein [Lutibacter sp.]|nr:MAG: hiran domain protein [Lutibacter sp.]